MESVLNMDKASETLSLSLSLWASVSLAQKTLQSCHTQRATTVTHTDHDQSRKSLGDIGCMLLEQHRERYSHQMKPVWICLDLELILMQAFLMYASPLCIFMHCMQQHGPKTKSIRVREMKPKTVIFVLLCTQSSS